MQLVPGAFSSTVPSSSPSNVFLRVQSLLEHHLQTAAKSNWPRAFGRKTQDPETFLYTWPEDAFLKIPTVPRPHRSPQWGMLPPFEDVLSKKVWREKEGTNDEATLATKKGEQELGFAHARHGMHMWLYLLRKAGGAPDGIQHSVSARYFDKRKKQVLYL